MPTKDEEARALAHTHYAIEEGLTHVFRIMAESTAEVLPTEPIKLLEVNEYTVPSGILPIYFGPSPASGVNYPIVIMEVTPDEYRQIQNDELRLPHGWRIGDPIPRPTAEVRA